MGVLNHQTVLGRVLLNKTAGLVNHKVLGREVEMIPCSDPRQKFSTY